MTFSIDDNIWDTSEQGNGINPLIDEAGKRLSILWNCAIKYPAFEKNGFQCRHGLSIPYFMMGNNDTTLIFLHEGFIKLRQQGLSVEQANIKVKEK